ncbi:MAG: ABC transporter ATP-binding protein/permease, partial [Oscillospiraceae bacterium]|nr:ABC transporter ATP-binding protein/permease [Oscillospiraceae bacterium]
MKKLKYNISMIKRGLLVMFKIEKLFITLKLTAVFIQMFTPYVNIFMTAKILNELSGAKNMRTLLIYAVMTVCLNFGITLIVRALWHLIDYHQNQFYKNEQMYFSEKIMSMDYENLENRDIHLLYEQVKIENQCGYNAYFLFTFLSGIVENTTSIILSTVLTFGLFTNKNISMVSKLIMVLLFFAVIFANYFSSRHRSKYESKMYESYAPLNAMGNFYGDYMLDYNTGKDIRLYGLEKSITNIMKKFWKESNSIGEKIRKVTLKFEILESACGDILSAAAYIFVALACIAGHVLVGDIIMYVGCITRFITSVGFNVNHSQLLVSNNKYLEHYFQFLDIPSKMYQGSLPIEKRTDNKYEIEFKNVSFKYPGTDTYALKNLSMKLNIGQRLAVVGQNGSGKTTMIKLLCRLYDPTEGEITLNGYDIKKYDYKDYMSIFSVVFQDFKLFSFGLGQNVAAGVEVDEQRAAACLEMAGLGKMAKGLKTPLYKDFEEDGVEISGGEAQKIALARALYKDAPFIVLDEPTAALDPIAEYEVYSKFDEIAGGKT